MPFLQQQFKVTIETSAPHRGRAVRTGPLESALRKWLWTKARHMMRAAVYRITDSQPKPKLKHEQRCKEILEELFQRPFPKVKPPWLVNPVTNRRLELDMYCHELSLAVEYDGVQHAQFTEHFHKDHADFEAQQFRDRVKDRRCQENGVVLIRVPATVPYRQLDAYLLEQLRRAKKSPQDVHAATVFGWLSTLWTTIFWR
eukprot:EG_transcript_29535